IENAPQVVSLGTIALDAEEQAQINTVAVAASLGVALSETVGVAVSGAGAGATNVILTNTSALIQNSTVQASGNEDVTATARSTTAAATLTMPATYAAQTKTTATGASAGGSSAFAADLDYAGQTQMLASSETDNVNGQSMTFAKGTPDPNVTFLTKLQSML